MLTGDKIETAKCIAISAGLQHRRQTVFEIKDAPQPDEIFKLLRELDGSIASKMLIIDGNSLSVVLSDQKLEETFFGVAKDAPSVCICRCSPTQKAVVASKLQFYTKKRIACVGDGGNDVAMI